MRQAIDNTPVADWNRVRPTVFALQPNLSLREQTFYGWLAGLYAFLVPWGDMLMLPYQVQFTRPLVLLAIISWLLSWRADTAVRKVGFPIYAMLLFIILVPAHFLTADDPERTGRRLLSYLGLFLMTVFFQQAVRSLQAYSFVLRCFIAGCCVPLGGLAWNLISGITTGDGRYTAPGFDPNDLAGQIALSIPIASYLAFNLAKGAIWFRLYLPVAVVGVLLTGSRAGLVVLLLASIYPVVCLIRRMKRGKMGIVAALICTAWAVNYMAPSIAFSRLGTMSREVSARDMNGRGTVWNSGLQLFWENPVIGIGAGGFAGAVSGGTRMAAHSTYLEVLVEHGIVGLAVFLAIVFGLLSRVNRFPPDERFLWRIVLGSWMVLVTTLSWENREITWLIWGLCCSLIIPQAKTRVIPTGARFRAA